MYYFVQNVDNQLYKITEEKYKEIKENGFDVFELAIINPTNGKYEWIDPETDEWEVVDIEDLDT